MNMQILTDYQLEKQVPSIYTTQAHGKVSDKYKFIPTIECVEALKKIGFYVVKAEESRCRLSDNKPYTKHMLRFRQDRAFPIGGNVPEVVLINSHNGLSSYQLRAGIYRLVCSNGLVVGNDAFYRSVRHQGDAVEKVVEAVGEIIEIVPEVLKVAEEWKQIELNPQQKSIYAESASLIKWGEDEIKINPERLLSPKRTEDTKNDLWTTFNTVQENIIRGGVRYYNSNSHKRMSTRAVNSVSENNRLNTALWNLTEKMASITK